MDIVENPAIGIGDVCWDIDKNAGGNGPIGRDKKRSVDILTPSFLANCHRTSAITTEAGSLKRWLREWALWNRSSGESPVEWASCLF